jgi:GDP-4-dehydro-6-deoxy-D-mannose reductase
VTVGEIATRLAGRSSRALSITSDPELVRPVEVSYLVGDPGKLQRLTRWKPHYSLDETLDAVLEEARARAQGS